MAVARIVVDTNVFVGALLRREGSNRKILRACLEERLRPIMGQTLFLEYEDVFGRKQLFRDSPLSVRERQQMFDAFLSVCEWVKVYYGGGRICATKATTTCLNLPLPAALPQYSRTTCWTSGSPTSYSRRFVSSLPKNSPRR